MKRTLPWTLFLLPVLMLLVAALVFGRLPEQIPVHFNFAGEVDRYGSRWTLFYMGLLALAMPVLREFSRRTDPRRQNYRKFGREADLVLFLVELMLFAVQLCVILFAMGYTLSIERIVPVLVGILFILCGNYMPRFRQNFYWGIKTPWTLSSEEVWTATHRFGGKIFFIGGFVMAAMAITPAALVAPISCVLLAVMICAPLIYSYLLYRKLDRAS